MGPVMIMGTVAPGYESVQEMFKKSFEKGSVDKAQLCVYVEGHIVVDLWGIGSSTSLKYTGNSLQNVFSSTKSLTALCIACMVDKGLLDYNEKVATYWPEFSKHGKDLLTLADILRHEGGLPWFDQSLQMDDISTDAIKNNSIGNVIEEQKLNFPPAAQNTNREYHAVTRGLILNEIFRRVEPQGRTIGQYLREEISKPLEADAYIGMPDSQLGKMADVRTWGFPLVLLKSCVPKILGRNIEPSLWSLVRAISSFANKRSKEREVQDKPPALAGLSEEDPSKAFQFFNTTTIRQAELPSANGSCSARGLAKIAACIVNGGELDGVRIVSEEALRKMHEDPVEKELAILKVRTEFSQGGVNCYKVYDDQPAETQESNRIRSGFVGWGGLGGSVFQWHPELKIGFAFVPTQMHWFDFANLRGGRYQAEVVECVRRLKKTEDEIEKAILEAAKAAWSAKKEEC